jgi:hypothetical protein
MLMELFSLTQSYWTGNILTFSYAEFYLIKVFQVLDLNNKYYDLVLTA